jgi:hypothetical protein
MTDSSKPLPRSIRGGRPFFFDDPATDKVLNMVVTLASEVWALRERLAAVEGAQTKRGALATGEIDGWTFAPDDETRLAEERRAFIENLFRVLQEQVDSAAARSPAARRKASARPGPFGARVAAVARPRAKRSGTAPAGRGRFAAGRGPVRPPGRHNKAPNKR